MLGHIIRINEKRCSYSCHRVVFSTLVYSVVQKAHLAVAYREKAMKEISGLKYQSEVEVFPTRMVSKAERYIFKSLHSSFTEY